MRDEITALRDEVASLTQYADELSARPTPILIFEMAAQVVVTALQFTQMSSANAARLFTEMHAAMTAAVPASSEATTGEPTAAVSAAKPAPAVPIEDTIHDDYLVSLEDGKRYKSLKRHLRTNGMTPQEYRAKWGLPGDYPMVCASYSKQRSDMAKAMGLGKPKPVLKPVRAVRRKAA
jgi:predicted transcriptional regulator